MCDLKRTLDATVICLSFVTNATTKALTGTLCTRDAFGDREDSFTPLLDRLLPTGNRTPCHS